MEKYEIEYMTRQEVKERLLANPVMILPVGSTEQHGFHLPLGTDTILAKALAKRTAQKTNSLIIPALNYGYSWVWHKIPGTVTLEQEHFKIILKDIVKSVEEYGTKILVIINGHDSNNHSIKYAVRELKYESSVKILYFFYPKFSSIYEKYCENCICLENSLSSNKDSVIKSDELSEINEVNQDHKIDIKNDDFFMIKSLEDLEKSKNDFYNTSCVETSCIENELFLLFEISSIKYKFLCKKEGYYKIKYFDGVIKCPDPELICNKKYKCEFGCVE